MTRPRAEHDRYVEAHAVRVVNDHLVLEQEPQLRRVKLGDVVHTGRLVNARVVVLLSQSPCDLNEP